MVMSNGEPRQITRLKDDCGIEVERKRAGDQRRGSRGPHKISSATVTPSTLIISLLLPRVLAMVMENSKI